MSVKVNNVSKYYGHQKALDQVSFEVYKGEVAGFLGPNGAGKSTMMKIITCFLPPSTGSVLVNGYDILENSIEVRRQVGYLPEHNPLYLDMYVREYLHFVAGLHSNIKNISSRVDDMISLTGLEIEKKKKIGALSKGFRQRVGLAQALIHDPQVLILDEPTSGLDPNQLVEIRSLIRNIGREKTVILSTHIMQEVEAICNRVIIISKGIICADDTTASIQQKVSGENTLLVEFNKPVEIRELMQIPGVISAQLTEGNRWRMKSISSVDIREAVFRFAVDRQLVILNQQKESQSLEEIFQQLTSSN